MAAIRRPSLPVALGLFSALLLPALFLIDAVVDRAGRRTAWLDARLEARLDGGRALTLAVPLLPIGHAMGLQVSGTGRVLEAEYPWRATAVDARLDVWISPELVEAGGGDWREDGFTASLTTRRVTRSDGLGQPTVPCRGRLRSDLAGSGALGRWERAFLDFDLICTGSGPDLRFGTGDENVWTIVGPATLKRG